MSAVQGFFSFDQDEPNPDSPKQVGDEIPPPGPEPISAAGPAPRYFEDMATEEQVAARRHREGELAAVASLSFPVRAWFDGEPVSVLGPAGRYSPYREELERSDQEEDPNQLLAQRDSGERFVSFASSFDVDGKLLVTPTLPPRPREFLPSWARATTEGASAASDDRSSRAAACPLEAYQLHLDQAEMPSSVPCPSASGERADEPRRNMQDNDSPEPRPEQDQARRTGFHEAVRRHDLLRAARQLGFEEPELEAAFGRHARADLFEVAFQVATPLEHPDVTTLRELEGEFVALAAERWAVRLREFPALENLAHKWAEAFERGGELSELQVRRALGILNSYEEKQERRRERLERAAERAEHRSADAFEQSNKAIEGIPFGQPILVGHHSEQRHRRAIDKCHRAMDRSVEEQRRAEDLARKANAVGKAGISADDPDAAVKLRERLAELDQEREQMKRVNAQFRKGGWEAVQGLSAEARDRFKQTMVQAPWIRTPFPSYSLQNIGANIRRIRERIEELEAKVEERAPRALEGPGYRLEEDRADNRIRFTFDGKPPEKTRALLKSMGFRWSPTARAWQRQASPAGWAAAERVRAELDQVEEPKPASHYYATPHYFCGEDAPRGWVIQQRHNGGMVEEGRPAEDGVYWTKQQAQELAERCNSGRSVPGIRWSSFSDGD